jgi:hypothetical protein
MPYAPLVPSTLQPEDLGQMLQTSHVKTSSFARYNAYLADNDLVADEGQFAQPDLPDTFAEQQATHAKETVEKYLNKGQHLVQCVQSQ